MPARKAINTNESNSGVALMSSPVGDLFWEATRLIVEVHDRAKQALSDGLRAQTIDQLRATDPMGYAIHEVVAPQAGTEMYA